jgi:hypothetical protein
VEEQRMGNQNVNLVRNTCHEIIWEGETQPWVTAKKWLSEKHYCDRQTGGWIG